VYRLEKGFSAVVEMRVWRGKGVEFFPVFATSLPLHTRISTTAEKPTQFDAGRRIFVPLEVVVW
jgi:hypothetical protein